MTETPRLAGSHCNQSQIAAPAFVHVLVVGEHLVDRVALVAFADGVGRAEEVAVEDEAHLLVSP